MPNRQQRRKAQKQQKKIKRPTFTKLTLEEREEQLFKNGITIKDLEQEFKNGFESGYEQGSHGVMETCYAAFCLALREVAGFDKNKILEVLYSADGHVARTLTSLEIRDQVLDEVGIELHFKEAFTEDRITEKEAGPDGTV